MNTYQWLRHNDRPTKGRNAVARTGKERGKRLDSSPGTNCAPRALVRRKCWSLTQEASLKQPPKKKPTTSPTAAPNQGLPVSKPSGFLVPCVISRRRARKQSICSS
ncbi:hypothetical protein V8C26DRAFT_403763 [Trichoderma gracile]